MAFDVGDTIGDYQIVGILGAGGMGKVYKVRNTISDRIEAVKVLLPDLANESELADRFMREIKLLASLNHPNIAQLHTAMRLNNQLLMVMEFVEGRTLEDRLKEGPIPVAEAVDVSMQVLSALAFAHERGVVHRDIKPANMMVTPGGQVKLMDFGIAKAVADRRLTMTGTTLGSLFYMSPEQVKGSGDLDGRSDIYSVGVSLYEMVTGTRPFKGDSDYSIMVAHLEQQAVPPIQVDPRLPPALNEIIMAAIEKEPSQRFQSAQAFRGALDSVRQTFGPAAAPAAIPPAMAVPPQPRPTAPAAAPPQAAPPARVAPAPPPAVPSAKPARRGLWVAVGAVLVLAVLAVAAIQLPRYFRTRAGEQQAAPAAEQQPAAQPAPVPATPAADTPAQPETAAPAAANPPAAETAPPPVVAEPKAPPAPSRKTVITERRALSQPASATPQVPMQAPAAAEQPAQPQAPPIQAQPAPTQPAPNAGALQEQRERFDTVAMRANGVRPTLQNLERQQQASGVGMRTDISTSWKRMEYLLDQAQGALQRGDAAAAKKNIDAAEREADRLDKFLGH